MQHWLVKQEPEEYGWADFVREGRTVWSGVRNFQARNHLRAMKRGDVVLFYESVTTKAVVGIANVAREAFPDPTATEGDWSAVELAAGKPLPQPVSLEAIKASAPLKDIGLLRQSRLSVMPVTARQYETLLRLGGTR
ncbi:EVE domain-containing protein [Nibricoccus sp. IMCC34717]|uniref:EVE domain-containing protein n=1 Tax=Nibricoccus sp. IMCC34717 TaxID=3034021 RepID=UPI0038509B3C